MADIILWALLAFFGAFGLVEFVRFVYSDWNSSEKDFHVLIQSAKAGDNLEGIVRNALIETGGHPIVILSDSESDVAEKLQNKYEHITLMSTDEYIKLLKEC